MMSTSAEFTDIGSLPSGAAVEMVGVDIGRVTHIQLDGSRAKVTLRFPASAHVPTSVIAQIRRAAILGPQVIELLVPTGTPSASLLANHATIASTDVRPDIEDLIKSGSDLIGSISTSELASLVEDSAQGFGGEGARLHQVLDDLDTIVTGYASRTTTITSLINNLDTFASAVGPAAQADAQALSNLAQSAQILDAQRVRLTNLLSALSSVSEQGVALLAGRLPQITDQLVALRAATQALANQQTALGRLLLYAQGHNLALAQTTNNNFVQVLLDFIICGLPGNAGGDQPGSPSSSCEATGVSGSQP